MLNSEFFEHFIQLFLSVQSSLFYSFRVTKYANHEASELLKYHLSPTKHHNNLHLKEFLTLTQ